MADEPRVQQPYANLVPPPTGTIPKPPGGPVNGKRSQAELALQGLVGAK